MGQFTAEQRTFIVLHYNRTQSLAAVQNAFRERFPDRNPPTKTTILKNFRKYCNHGTSLNRNKNNSGRPRTARSPENIAAVRRLYWSKIHAIWVFGKFRHRRRSNVLNEWRSQLGKRSPVCTQRTYPPEFNFDWNNSRAKLTVWVGLCGNGDILGPYFFERNVDGIAYLQMLLENVFPMLVVHFRNQVENDCFAISIGHRMAPLRIVLLKWGIG